MAVNLKDKVAIVTGGAVGIGAAVSRKFSSLGATVLVTGLPGDPVPELVEEIRDKGGRAEAYIGDIAVESQADLCVQTAIEEYGQLDILVHLAGAPMTAIPTEHFRTSDFDRVLYANVRSVFLMTKYALPELRETRGCLVAGASEAGGLGLVLNPAHAATRSWVYSFIKGVAVEAAPWGVRANCVCPGVVEARGDHFVREFDPGVEDQIVRATPLGRRGKPEEVAAVYAFLASSEASFVTGALYSVDGGLNLGIASLGEVTRYREPTRRNEDASL